MLMKNWDLCTGCVAQRTIKRAELTAFLRLLKKVTGPIKVHVDGEGIVDGI